VKSNYTLVWALLAAALLTGCNQASVPVNQLLGGLPKCEQLDTLTLMESVINHSDAAKAANAKFVMLKNITEQGYNDASEIRACHATLVTTAGEDNLQYSIKWQNKAEKQFWVDAAFH
jgi:hypothetical protein